MTSEKQIELLNNVHDAEVALLAIIARVHRVDVPAQPEYDSPNDLSHFYINTRKRLEYRLSLTTAIAAKIDTYVA